MDIALLIIGLLLCIVGIIGSILPVLPGLPISWIGVLLFYFTSKVEMNYTILIISFVLMLLISVADYLIPAAGTKRYGGSKAASWGTTIGLIVGILAPIPFGFLIGPFVGAFIGQLFFTKESSVQSSFKAATGSFFGFIASTFMKFFTACVFLGFYIYLVIKHYPIF
ncbi:DUF456 domain-containing protein [Mesonia sp. K7]|uniref:DUF456 domain-containing protein n=1 Tax=Mesonia sp. K7 TaxID=2218606 RepID=UPI000DA89971|nr:DUF456 domain-containing protein [Mesonia sp. K7]PZD76976.1 DUF456 domain-containing protein [Mesonia sp. K7]